VAGATLPEGVPLDGHGLVPVLAGKAKGSRQWIYSQLGKSRIVRDARFKLDRSGALFDLQNDPLEKPDLRDSTDATVVAARQRLTHLLNRFPQDTSLPFEGYRGTARKQKHWAFPCSHARQSVDSRGLATTATLGFNFDRALGSVVQANSITIVR